MSLPPGTASCAQLTTGTWLMKRARAGSSTGDSSIVGKRHPESTSVRYDPLYGSSVGRPLAALWLALAGCSSRRRYAFALSAAAMSVLPPSQHRAATSCSSHRRSRDCQPAIADTTIINRLWPPRRGLAVSADGTSVLALSAPEHIGLSGGRVPCTRSSWYHSFSSSSSLYRLGTN